MGAPHQVRIARRTEESNASLAQQTELGWALPHEHHYQMASRFAWSWKLMEGGYPVILVFWDSSALPPPKRTAGA